ncbi:hypothetical protein I5Q34_07475 [Streptomyces sp. AV19]|uniref:hypothetical protein n=1 Tax=Streptomyces sp. AV19 TaxID=2793068 RepID=UPI0018FE6D1C|nr:hypothetical protein [Streptomyces sp. AV19]MBH1934136.1 hypothetical protein [Streptomyces sp. AV19]MDG4537142.1 hypothetical protein [Streptomyces sp. AV19]
MAHSDPGASGENSNQSPGPSPWTRVGFIGSAGFVVLVVLLAVLVVTDGDDSGSTPPARAGGSASATHGPSSAPAPSAPAVAGGSCPKLADTGQGIPDKAPSDVEWSLFETVALPTSKSAGPAVVDGDVARCYARTPTGALMAAMQIGTRYFFAPHWREVTEQQTVGDGKDAYLALRKKAEASAKASPNTGPDEDSDSGHGQLAGYKIVSFTPDAAVVQLVNKFPDAAMQVGTVTVTWVDGDWRLTIPQSVPPATYVQTLDGYIPFGGV